MCKMCDSRFFSSEVTPRIETEEVKDVLINNLVLDSWDCWDDCPDETYLVVNFCPECGKDLRNLDS